ncbi:MULTISPECIES: hypothetical protein [Bacillus]|uniref:hypothetical protein n=1 Tax=Bacillus TaxID=1386 RepID=UPI00101DC933|nr:MULTISPECIES: hypothetical protein [Bacillus]MDT0160299.1 hypothetical protein [Bacillus sp. AG4(2022)]RYI30584.1 hypothetical protein EVU96_09215 [Bacillus infantis]
MGTTLIVMSVVKLAGACGLGIGASGLMKYFHEVEFKFKKKGDKNDNSNGESLREKARSLS